MISHHERITYALDHLTRELQPFIEREMEAFYKDKWVNAARESFRKDRSLRQFPDSLNWDTQSILTVMWDQWNSVFRHRLGHIERSLVSELREFRNRWAHQERFNFDDTYRVVDSVERLIRAIDFDAAKIVAKEKRDLLRDEFTKEMTEAAKQARIQLRRWRNITTYIVCGCALVFALFNTFGNTGLAWWGALAVILIFVYFSYEALTTEPVIYEPHECQRCGRIIYTEPCPYCGILGQVPLTERVKRGEVAEEEKEETEQEESEEATVSK